MNKDEKLVDAQIVEKGNKKLMVVKNKRSILKDFTTQELQDEIDRRKKDIKILNQVRKDWSKP